ncbi:aspartate:alanine exchanger family transporter [Natranaerobius thermophilus]|uniref:YidE/YbjL duplication n=1 Tax=Natranaerobius thermophilus (strain ATCC BAA-1301 / DSM 18059 / JW/NM-WN-LF) TaxID=457570 RepID=B2A889_NATTJ|nr:aspartate:alanine exchanger family transporter [Natranaerobius thermophilus]ACB84455.1 YidE/YbjL duplication [Natranaerobius thermophilus JW/NM-WN-LF]
MSIFHETPVLTIFTIILLGLLLGSIQFKGLKLGASGVLLVALLMGHFGFEIPKVAQDLGLALFVLSVGLKAGPRFFRMLKRKGIAFSGIGLAIVISTGLITLMLSKLLNIPAPLGIGLMTGALTSTPGLAAAIEATGDPMASVGYGIAYPFGVIAVVMFVQLVPKIKKDSFLEALQSAEADKERKQQRKNLISKAFRVENPELHKKTLAEIKLQKKAEVIISRIFRHDRSFVGRNDAVLLQGDHINVVGTSEELKKVDDYFGPSVEINDKTKEETDTEVENIIMNRDDLAGKTLQELNLRHNPGVTITRVERSGIEFLPKPGKTLDKGDICTAVGTDKSLKELKDLFASKHLQVSDVDMLPISVFLLSGILLGMIPIFIPGLGTIQIGVAGGPLFAGLIASHFGRIGPLKARFNSSGLNTINSLGLTLFLAGAGTSAGSDLVTVIAKHGIGIFASGAVITLVPLIISAWLVQRVFKLNLVHGLGAICGGMTSTPGLGALNDITDSEEPSVAYAAVYPLALILVAISSQLLALLI